jgi:predicted acyl esterase
MEWPDYYNRTSTEDLRRFFDYYLKDIQNGWKETPRVRMSVLDPGGKDIVEREENEFPLIRAEYVKLNLDADTGRLTTGPVNKKASVNYNTDSGQGHTSFTISFDQETELSGYMKLRLWVEAQGSNDMDLFVYVRKLDNEGKLLVHKTIDAKSPVLRHLLDSGVLSVFLYYGPSNRLRVSRRQLDPARSTETEPYLTYRVEERLNPGQIVPLEIPLWPTAMRWHPGEQLQVIVAGYDLVGPPFPNIPALQLCNKGEHIIHTGGEYDSHLLVPVIPSKSW